MKNTLKSCTVTIPNIDLEQLKLQKSELLRIIASPKDVKSNIDTKTLEGLLGLIDAIQDTAVKDNKFNENKVYVFSKND